MDQKNRIEGNDKREGGAERDFAQADETPMERFRALTKKLVNVPRDELQAQRQREAEKKSG
jgi:hypothetical protein